MPVEMIYLPIREIADAIENPIELEILVCNEDFRSFEVIRVRSKRYIGIYLFAEMIGNSIRIGVHIYSIMGLEE